jgi:hypothetical protein
MGTGSVFSRLKRKELEADNLLSLVSEVKKSGDIPSLPPYVFGV